KEITIPHRSDILKRVIVTVLQFEHRSCVPGAGRSFGGRMCYRMRFYQFFRFLGLMLKDQKQAGSETTEDKENNCERYHIFFRGFLPHCSHPLDMMAQQTKSEKQRPQP